MSSFDAAVNAALVEARKLNVIPSPATLAAREELADCWDLHEFVALEHSHQGSHWWDRSSFAVGKVVEVEAGT